MEWQKKQSAVQAIQALNKEPSQWNTDQLKTMVPYKKNKHDAKLPMKKVELIQSWEETTQRLTSCITGWSMGGIRQWRRTLNWKNVVVRWKRRGNFPYCCWFFMLFAAICVWPRILASGHSEAHKPHHRCILVHCLHSNHMRNVQSGDKWSALSHS